VNATARSVVWTALNVLLALMFAFSVAVQYNDPDPIRWMAIYGAALVVSVLEIRRRTPRWLPVLVAIVALVWAATIAPRVIGHVRFLDMFASFEMKNEGIEESREMYGLLIVAAWMAVVLLLAERRRSGSARAIAATR
jgi:hypothetical protein